jgi:hypothetical protein
MTQDYGLEVTLRYYIKITPELSIRINSMDQSRPRETDSGPFAQEILHLAWYTKNHFRFRKNPPLGGR